MLVGITGATGFIGKALACEHVKRGDQVRILSRKDQSLKNYDKIIFYLGDLTESSNHLIPFVEGVDVLYHCAGEIRNKDSMFDVHVTGTKNLCQAAFGKIGHWVQLSSVGAYGLYAGGTITENTTLNPLGVYETTKTESEKIAIQASHSGAFSYSILRPSNVYGPEMTNRSLFLMIEMINKGFFFFIGPPGASANYIHVANVVEALKLCGDSPASRGKEFNISDYLTIEEFVAVIAEELERPVPSLRIPEKPLRWLSKVVETIPGFPLTFSRIDALTNRSIYSNQKIQSELGYQHVVSMEEGLRQLVKAWKQSGKTQKVWVGKTK